jgi:hypothetical protein
MPESGKVRFAMIDNTLGLKLSLAPIEKPKRSHAA